MLLSSPPAFSQVRSKPQRNVQMTGARVARKDEFYTKLVDIATECDNYAEHFRNKHILCPCDGLDSNFLKYFEMNFEKFGLASLTCIGFGGTGQGFKYVKKPGVEPVIEKTLLNGDYRSFEVLALFRETDIVVTNPPFSLFRHFVEMVVRYKKKFLLLGNIVTIGSKDMERLVRTRQMWFGYFGQGAMEFTLPENYPQAMRTETNPDGSVIKFATVSSICWATNLPVNKPFGHKLTAKYDPTTYPKYDNYDAIEVKMLRNIPKDYDGVMGVPITFVVNWDPEQFDIIGFTACSDIVDNVKINDEVLFRRVFIQKRKI